MPRPPGCRRRAEAHDSPRNFGHGCITAQSGLASDLAAESRGRWLELAGLAGLAGFWARRTGTVVVARADDERQVLRQLHESRAGAGVRLLDPEETRARAGSTAPDVVGGAFLDGDIRVDPREAVPAIARWLADQPGVTFLWSTMVHGAADGTVRTSRGDLSADHVILCPGHDAGWLRPDITEEHNLLRCRLHMLRVDTPLGRRIEPAVLSGLSMLRYSAMASQPAASEVRARFESERPDLLDLGVNLMYTQRPDGSLLIGDTHDYSASVSSFADEDVDQLLLTEAARLLGVGSLRVLERWAGVYASTSDEFLVRDLDRRTTLVLVTSGIGMTTGLGLAASTLAGRIERDTLPSR